MGPRAVSGNPAGKAGLADAPAVELALSRSKLYLLLSWGFLYPEEEEFYNYLQDGEFVEDGLSAVESLEKSFEAAKASPAARDLILPIRKLIEQIGEWEQENFKTWEFSDLQDEHRRVFFHLLCELGKAYLKFECAYLGVKPQPYKETDYKPATFNPPEGASFECGAQDLGNELTVLLDEVGGRSQMDEGDTSEGSGDSGKAGHA